MPLLVDEAATGAMQLRLRADGALAVWWATPVECGAAIARREREGKLTAAGANAAFARMRGLEPSWMEIGPAPRVRDVALRLVRTHPLRAADSLQLAAALVAAEDNPAALGFVCLDERLALAAEREGLAVVR